MSFLDYPIDAQNQTYLEKQKEMKSVIDELNKKLNESKNQGPDKAIERHLKQGKYLARERIVRLLDPGTEFLELMPLAGLDQKDMTLGGSIVGGIGFIHGKPCVINANVPTQKGGALNLMSVLKGQRLDTIAEENKLPCIYLVESAGAHLSQQAQVYNLGGKTFRNITRRSAKGIPSLTLVFGSSTAGGAYIPGMSDYIIMVKKQAKVFLAGPPLVKMAINEETEDELLGGAEMHARLSGVADFLAENEDDALMKARDLIHHLNIPMIKRASFQEPHFSREEILGLISPQLNRPFKMKEILARLLDNSEFIEFKKEYGPTLLCGYGKIHGHDIGIIANQGVLVSEAANKGAQFIQLCNQDQRPLLFLQNITGFMVGKKVEQEGIVKHGAKMINAVANSRVPAITIIMGASYGAGNYAMCGRSYEPRFLFTWPISRLAVMGPEQLAGVMEMIKREAAKKSGATIDEHEMKKLRDQTISQIENESHSYYATSHLWDDGIIDPRDTRKILGQCFDLIKWSQRETTQGSYGVFRM